MENAQTDNSAACGQSRSTVGRMFLVEKFDHPDLVGGIVWADCELSWINERITLAILAEREACAQLCDEQRTWPISDGERWMAGHLADAIRMRSNDKAQGEAQGSSRLSPGATGSTTRGTED